MDALDYALISLGAMILWLLFSVSRDLRGYARKRLGRVEHEHARPDYAAAQPLVARAQTRADQAFASRRAMS